VGIGAVRSLDPLAVSGTERSNDEKLVLRQLFEGLVAYDPVSLRAVPGLASWSASPDARTFTFLLKPGIRFHSGRDVTADDVVFSLNRLARAACNPASAPTAGAPSYLLAAVVGYAEVAGACTSTSLPGVVKLSPRSVMISLGEPWADFPSALGNVAASIVPADIVGRDEAAFATRPVGTGPYRLVDPWDGSALRLVRFDGYRGPPPAVASIRFVGYPDEGAAYLELLQGTLQYAPVPSKRVGQSRRRFGTDGFARGTGLYFFGFNLRSQRLGSHDFRVGLSRAVDRRSLATAIFEATREPARGLAPPSLAGAGGRSCRDACTFSVDAARAAIAKAYPQGPPEITIGVSSGGANPPVAQALAQMFGRAGVTARVIERPFADHVEGVRAGDVDVFQLGWIPDYPALDALYWPLFHSGSKDNYMGYANSDVDRLLTEARRALDDRVRARLFEDVEKLVLEDLPLLPLLWYRAAIAYDRRLQAGDGRAVVDGLGMTSFADVRFRPA
jgi:ABC-type transport system substrate-binding protein